MIGLATFIEFYATRSTGLRVAMRLAIPANLNPPPRASSRSDLGRRHRLLSCSTLLPRSNYFAAFPKIR
jgi:hypothetical protein